MGIVGNEIVDKGVREVPYYSRDNSFATWEEGLCGSMGYSGAGKVAG